MTVYKRLMCRATLPQCYSTEAEALADLCQLALLTESGFVGVVVDAGNVFAVTNPIGASKTETTASGFECKYRPVHRLALLVGTVDVFHSPADSGPG